jgi:hypothetical protein
MPISVYHKNRRNLLQSCLTARRCHMPIVLRRLQWELLDMRELVA